MRKILSSILVLFMIAASVLPQNYAPLVYANSPEGQGNLITYPTTTDVDFDASQIAIKEEDVNKRSEYSKTFKKIDGTYEVALYNEAIHYQDNGKWKQIDNSLIDNGNSFENKDNKFKIKFPKTIDDNKQIKFTYKGYSIDWSINDIDSSKITYPDEEIKSNNIRELNNINQLISYVNIQPNVDIQYILNGSNLKENIIMNQYVDNYEISFNYKLKNLEIIESENGNIVFLNEDGEAVINFSDFYMYDSNDKMSNDIEYKITQIDKNTYKITITPNNKWLNEASFPVTIDPSLVIDETDNPGIRDKYVYPAGHSDYANYLKVGKTSSSTYKTYIEISTYEIPENAIVSYAHLQLRTYYNESYNHCDYLSCQINAKAVNDSSSWDNITNYNFNDVDSSIIDYEMVYPSDTGIAYYRWDLSEIMNDWLEDNRTEGIIELSKQTLVTNDYIYFASEEYVNSMGPSVLVGYQYTTGLYDFWTYHSAPVGDAGTALINDFTGELNLSRRDYVGQHDGLKIDLGMFYSENQKDTNVGYGLGWSTNYNSTAEEIGDQYVVTNPSGSKVYFDYVPASDATDEPEIRNNYLTTYLADDGSRNILVEYDYDNDSVDEILVYTTDRVRSIYEDGILVKVEDLKIEQSLDITLNAASKIEQITDYYGNNVIFEYNSTTGNLDYQLINLCQSWDVNDHCTETNLVQVNEFNYSTSSSGLDYNLYQVTYHKDYSGTTSYLDVDDSSDQGFSSFMTNASSNDVIAYEYYDTVGGDDRLETVESSEGLILDLDYDNINRINQYTFTMGSGNLGFISITYNYFNTIFEDQTGNKVRYSFDSYGHTVNTLDDYGNATFTRYLNPWSYTFDIKNVFHNHLIVESSLPQKTQLNPLVNHSFEYGLSNWDFTIDRDDNVASTPYASYSDSESVYGNYSAFIRALKWQEAHLTQTVILDEGDYTFSGYIYGPTGTGGKLSVKINGTTTTSNPLSTMGEWEYVELNFHVYYNNATVDLNICNAAAGTVYYDNLQVTDSFVDTRVNIIDNPSFENSSVGWTLSSNATRVYDYHEEEQGDLYDSILGDYSIRIYGDADTPRYAQTTLSSGEFDTNTNYIIAAWAKGDVTPNKHYDQNPDGRTYGIIVTLSDGTNNDEYYFEFNSDIEDWQYQASQLYVDDTITSITIKVCFRGEGTVFFDGIQMYNESFGTEYEYDYYGNVEKIKTPESSGLIENYYSSSDRFMLDHSIDQNSKLTKYNNYGAGLFKNVSQNNVSSTVTYNSDNKVFSVSIGEDGNSDGTIDGTYYSNFVYYTDLSQYINLTKNEFGSEVEYTTNLLNGLLSAIENEIDVSTSYSYDVEGRLVTVSKDNTDNTYVYVDDLLSEIQVNGTVYKLEYDAYNRLEYVKVGTGTGLNFSGETLKQFIYEVEFHNSTSYQTGKIEQEIFGNGDQIKISYNDEDQIDGLWFYDTYTSQYIQRYSYKYNQSGYLTILNDLRDNQEYYYNYDIVGRVKKVTNQDGDVVSYEYDNGGNLHIYTFDIQGYERNITYTYHLSSGIYDKTEYGDVTKDYTFETDDLRRLVGTVLTLNTTTINSISYTYFEGQEVTYGDVSRRIKTITQTNSHHYITQTMEYNEQGYITKITDFSSDDVEYYYDSKDQLIRENNEVDDYTYVYEYDDYGNLEYQYFYSSFIAGNSTLSPSITYEYYTYDTTWQDKINYVYYYIGGSLNHYEHYNYDNSGNLTFIDFSAGPAYDRTFEWKGRSLTSLTIGSNTSSYSYNQNGIRDSKTVNSVTTTYYLDGALVLYETNGTDEIYYSYDVDGSLISMRLNGTEYFYLFDVFGNVSHLIDSNGYTVVSYTYDAYGNILTQSETVTGLADANPYRYRSYRYDNESGLYYLQSRYYNPKTGRFINADGMLKANDSVLGHNMFTYTENNPVNYTDETGYCLAEANGKKVNPDWRPRCNPYDQYPGMNSSSWGKLEHVKFYKSNVDLGVFTSLNDLIAIYADWIGIPVLTLTRILSDMNSLTLDAFTSSARKFRVAYVLGGYKIGLFLVNLNSARTQLRFDGYYHISKTMVGPITIGIWVKDNLIFYADEDKKEEDS